MPDSTPEQQEGLRLLPLWPVAEHLRPRPRDEGFDMSRPEDCPVYTLLPTPRRWTSADPTQGRFFDLTSFLSLDESMAVPFAGEA